MCFFSTFDLNSDIRVGKFGSIKFEFAKNLVRFEFIRVRQNSDPSLIHFTDLMVQGSLQRTAIAFFSTKNVKFCNIYFLNETP